MKSIYRKINERFVRLADAVSFGMGTPTNILFWILAVFIWFLLGIFNRRLFVNGKFLPDWFTSNAWNFPLNTVTTLLELYIGFLVAAAANRSERELRKIVTDIRVTIKKVEIINANQTRILRTLLKYEKKDVSYDSKIFRRIKLRDKRVLK